MRKIKLIINQLLTFVLLLVIFCATSFAQVESTLTGGPWTSPSTWVGNTVPGPHDKVLIKGKVQVDLITFAGSLTITNIGKIEMMLDDINHLSTFTVDNDVTNTGQIQGNNLNFKIGGNIVNQQIWESNLITLTGTNSHYLSTQSGGTNTFSPIGLRADSSKIISSTDIYLDNVKLQAQSFELISPFSLYLNKQSILAVQNFIGNNQSIFFSDNSTIKDFPVITASTQKLFSNLNNRAINFVTTKYSDIALKGTVQLGGSLITFGGTTVLNDSLFKMGGASKWDQVFIEGTFINNGNYNIYTTFVSNGTIENNGIWDGHVIDFADQTTNYISSGPSSKYLVSFINGGNTLARSTIYTKSDIYLWGGIAGPIKIVLQNNNSLYFKGTDAGMMWVNIDGMNNAIYSYGRLTLNSDTLNNTKLKNPPNTGIQSEIRIGNNNVLKGTTINEVSLLKDFGTDWGDKVEINGKFINRGYIRISDVNLSGDLENYGTWKGSPTYITLIGITNQSILIHKSSVFGTRIMLESDIIGSSYQWLKDGNIINGETFHNIILGIIDTTFTGRYQCSIDNGSSFSRKIAIDYTNLTSIEDTKDAFPLNFSLFQNYPNPFNPTTTISYQLSKASSISLIIYDIFGRQVKSLINKEQPAGYYNVKFDASSLSSGIYFYRISVKGRAGNFIQTKKLILLK